MVIVRLNDKAEYIWKPKEKLPPRKLTFQERNPRYNPNVNYKDKHLELLSEKKWYCPIWAFAQVKGFGSYGDMIHSMYYGIDSCVKMNETAYMYYEDDTNAIEKRSRKTASQEARETFGLTAVKSSKYPDKWFITFNWAPDCSNFNIKRVEQGVQRLFMKEYVLEARGCFEFYGSKKNHPHFMCVLKIDTTHNSIDNINKFKKVIKEASLAYKLKDNFIQFQAFEERHDDYVDLIKCDAKQDALDRDRNWRHEKGLREPISI